MQRLGQPLQQAADADLVDHLGQLPAAGLAHQTDHPRIGGNDRLGAGKGLRLATHHDCQHAILGTGLTTGYRRIEKCHPASCGLLRQLPRHPGRSGRVIDQHAALRHAGQSALLTQYHTAQVIVVANAGHHELRTAGRFGRRRRVPARKLRHPAFGLRRAAVIHADFVSLTLQMPSHRIAHHAKPDKRYLCHSRLPSLNRSAEPNTGVCLPGRSLPY